MTISGLHFYYSVLSDDLGDGLRRLIEKTRLFDNDGSWLLFCLKLLVGRYDLVIIFTKNVGRLRIDACN